MSKKEVEKTKKQSNTKKNKDETKTEKKESKPNKYTDVEKGDKPNKYSALVNLNMNVQITKKWMDEYYDGYEVIRKKVTGGTDEENDQEKKEKITYRGANTILTAMDEFIFLKIMTAAVKRTISIGIKGQGGYYYVTSDIIFDIINLDKEMKFVFTRFLENIDLKDQTILTLGIKKEILNKIINEKIENGESVVLKQEGLQVIMQLILKSRQFVCEMAYRAITQQKRGAIGTGTMKIEVLNYFNQCNKMIKDLTIKLTRVEQLYHKKVKHLNDENEEENKEENEENEENTKEDSSEEESEEENGESESEEEEEIVKPKKNSNRKK